MRVGAARGNLDNGRAPVYFCTTAGQPYRDLGLDYFDRLNQQNLERSLIKRLEKLGNRVTIKAARPAA